MFRIDIFSDRKNIHNLIVLSIAERILDAYNASPCKNYTSKVVFLWSSYCQSTATLRVGPQQRRRRPREKGWPLRGLARLARSQEITPPGRRLQAAPCPDVRTFRPSLKDSESAQALHLEQIGAGTMRRKVLASIELQRIEHGQTATLQMWESASRRADRRRARPQRAGPVVPIMPVVGHPAADNGQTSPIYLTARRNRAVRA